MIVWNSPPGQIFTCIEGEIVFYRLEAISPYNDVQYELLYGVIPVESFDPLTGIIQGRAFSVTNSMPFQFTIRAKSQNYPEIYSDRTFEIFVTKRARPPKWKNNPNLGDIFPNDSFYLKLEIDNDTNLTPTFHVDGSLPIGLQLNNDEIFGNVSIQNPSGINEFKIVATLNGLSSTLIFYFDFKKANIGPIWQTSSNLGTFYQGQSVYIKLNAVDPDGDSVVFFPPYGHASYVKSEIGIGGAVTNTVIIDRGEYYKDPPLTEIEFFAGGGAVGIAVLDAFGSVDAINVLNPGSNYAVPPIVTLTGGGGSGAQFVANVANGRIIGFTKISGGSGYTSPPTVNISTYITAAVATPKIRNGSIVDIEITNGGSGYIYPPIVIVKSPDPPIGGGALPLGLKISPNGEINGSISLAAKPGVYTFIVGALDSNKNYSEQIFTITVLPNVSGFVNFGNTVNYSTISWVTPTGNLGEIYENYPSYFYVEALGFNNNTLVDVGYTLAPGSSPLPPGTIIEQNSGSITGWIDSIPATTTYEFTVRAFLKSNPSIFLDRNFSIKVVKRFNAPFENYWFYFTGTKRKYLFETLVNTISPNDVFLPYNKDYGVIGKPRLLVKGGVKVKSSIDTWNIIKPGVKEIMTYHHSIDMIIGELFVLNVYDINKTKKICEVVVCSLYSTEMYEIKNKFGQTTKKYPPGGWNNNINVGVNAPWYGTITPPGIENIRKSFMYDFGLVNNEFIPQFLLHHDNYKNFGAGFLEIVYTKNFRGNFVKNQLLPIWNKSFLGEKITFDRYIKRSNLDKFIEIFPLEPSR